MSSVKKPRNSVTSCQPGRRTAQRDMKKQLEKFFPRCPTWLLQRTWQVLCVTFYNHRLNYVYCSSVFPFTSICTIQVQRKIWLISLNTSDSRSLGEMGLLIIGFYWLLCTPFASIYSTGRLRDSYSWRSGEKGQERYLSRKIAHKRCFRCFRGIIM